MISRGDRGLPTSTRSPSEPEALMQNQPTFVGEHPTLTLIIIVYVLISALMVFADVRRPIVRWYRSQIWLVSGTNVLDILLKQVGYRITVEMIAFAVACVVGPLGGNIYIVMRARSVKNVEQL